MESEKKAGEDMLRTFTAKEFRCFRDFTLGHLERVNLIAGRNNNGKTALLEALCLFSGPNNPYLALQLNSLRGMSQVYVDASDMWGWLFFRKNIDATIELIGKTDNTNTRTLKVRLEERLQISLSSPPPLSSEATTTAPPSPLSDTTTTAPPGPLSAVKIPREIVLDYTDSTGQAGISRAPVMPIGGQIQRAALTSIWPTWFLHTHHRTPQDDAVRFSKLEEIGRQEEIAAPVRVLEPRLKRLAVLVSNGLPIIHGELEGGTRMVPVPYMGEGMVRLISFLLAISSISSVAGGMVLIDEVENGLHYSVMEDVWKAIAQAARRHAVQVFATTHSWECIRAAHHAFKECGPYDFRYYRLDRRGEDISVKTLDERMLDTVEKTDLEVR